MTGHVFMYSLKVWLVACKEAITRKWYQPDHQRRMKIVTEICCTWKSDWLTGRKSVGKVWQKAGCTKNNMTNLFQHFAASFSRGAPADAKWERITGAVAFHLAKDKVTKYTVGKSDRRHFLSVVVWPKKSKSKLKIEFAPKKNWNFIFGQKSPSPTWCFVWFFVWVFLFFC